MISLNKTPGWGVPAQGLLGRANTRPVLPLYRLGFPKLFRLSKIWRRPFLKIRIGAMTERLIRTSSDWIAMFRAHIKKERLTHLEVDARAGLSEGHCGAIMCGRRKPNLRTIEKLCAGLGVSFMPIFDSDGRSSFVVES
jgi:hypothetical protein